MDKDWNDEVVLAPEEYSKLEKEFRDATAQHRPTIEDLAASAGKMLRRAIELSEKHGIPFDFNGRTYVPYTFETYTGVKTATLEELSGVSYLDNCTEGWNSSSWCHGG